MTASHHPATISRARASRRMFAAAVAVMTAASTACTAAPHHASPAPAGQSSDVGSAVTGTATPTGETVTVHLGLSQPIRIIVPGVATITGPADALSAAATIAATPVTGRFTDTGVQPAGTGVDLAFSGARLIRPLTVTFPTHTAPTGTVPVAVHQADDGSWQIEPMIRHGNTWTLTTSRFSPQIPAFLNPANIFKPIADWISGVLWGTTAPVDCPNPPTGWGNVNNMSNTTSMCTMSQQSGGHTDTELRIRSNRGYMMEVDVPGNPDYVWVAGQPWTLRKALSAALGIDPNHTILLPAGADMTAGYPRPAQSASMVVSAAATPRSEGVALILALVEMALSKLLDHVSDDHGLALQMVPLAYLLSKCSGEVDLAQFSFLDLSSVKTILGCITGDAASNLANPATAVGAANDLLGPDEAKYDAATQIKDLETVGSKLNALGWIVALWPFVQIGWEAAFDGVQQALTKGNSGEAELDLTAPSQAPPTRHNPPGGGNQPPGGENPAVMVTQGGAAQNGYWYAITLSGFAANASVPVTCFDSVSPGGFRTFTMTTDGSGSAATSARCYSGDGPGHWVVAGGVQSNTVSWGGSVAPPPTTSRPPPGEQTWTEYVGGSTHTWTDYGTAGGGEGTTIAAYTPVQVACAVEGFRVADGDTWWYRIASDPWNDQYFASADAFYNNGQTSGSLHGTPFVDPAVPHC